MTKYQWRCLTWAFEDLLLSIGTSQNLLKDWRAAYGISQASRDNRGYALFLEGVLFE